MALNNGDKLEITCKLKFNGTIDIINVYHYVMLSASDSSDEDAMDAIAEYFALAYEPLADIIPNNVTADTIKVFNITQNRLIGEGEWFVWFVGGAVSTSSAPLGVCSLLRLLTHAAGVQGRKFIGAIASSFIDDDGLLVAGAVAIMAEYGAKLLLPLYIGTGHARLYLLNRITGVANRVWEVVAGSIPAYQRRRKQGVGS